MSRVETTRRGGKYEAIGSILIIGGIGLGIFAGSMTVFGVIAGPGLVVFLAGRCM